MKRCTAPLPTSGGTYLFQGGELRLHEPEATASADALAAESPAEEPAPSADADTTASAPKKAAPSKAPARGRR